MVSCPSGRALQFFGEVLDEYQMVWRRIALAFLDHNKTSVMRYIVSSQEVGILFEKELRGSKHELFAELDVQNHHLGAAAVEKLVSVRIPDGLDAAVGGDQALTSGVRKRGDINLVAAGGVGHVGDPVPVGRELGFELVVVRLQKRYGSASPVIETVQMSLNVSRRNSE